MSSENSCRYEDEYDAHSDAGAIDWLTGLSSMPRFHRLAAIQAEAIRSRGDRPVVIALDLVGMKSYNTRYGRDEGDNLLCIFADELRKCFGSEACSRFGEDHFYVIAPFEGVGERIEALFADFKKANDGRTLPIRSGSYVCDEEDDIAEVGFDRAKIACNSDRKKWRSHNTWFSDEMRRVTHLRIHVIDSIDRAIAEGWIRPHYQALVRTATGNVCGEEALARWVDPKYGTLLPDQFIPVLEEAGLLQKLDMHMIECVLADIALKQKRGVSVVPVSVNISVRDLDEIDFVEALKQRVDAAGADCSLLKVEFTETAVSDAPEVFKAQVQALQDAGFGVWMDDFGSGHSSLHMLQEYSFDLIKLDMGFTQGLTNEKAHDIVAGVIRVAKKLGVSTLAEGVESEEQAVFLSNIGCDVLQGFYYTRPLPLDEVMDHFTDGVGIPREIPSEAEYWEMVGSVDLVDPLTNLDRGSVDGSPLAEFPAGILELRDGEWFVLRANRSCREFLDRTGFVSASRSHLTANPVERPLDEEFLAAAQRSLASRSWERVAGRSEYGTGFQFYVRPLAQSEKASAYVLASVPTMLGTALGAYGDVPAAYAVFRIAADEAKGEVVDAEYVYANSEYYEWGGYEEGSLTGRSFREVNGRSPGWFPHAYRAVVLGESDRDMFYSPEAGHWLTFGIAPSPVEGCCVIAFAIADDEHREREEMIVARNTSDLIVEIVDKFSRERDYETAMNAALEIMSHAINPSRLFIFERGQGIDWVTFEWCAEETNRQIGGEPTAGENEFNTWDKLATDGAVVYLPDISVLTDVDKTLHRKLQAEGVTHLLAAPLFDGEAVIGNLVAENYEFDEKVDVKRLLETVASFISSRIVNQRLLAELERTGTHDFLTGLLNRRGFDQVLAERIAAKPDEPYVLALMDIDDFKTVNDLHGHDVGDAALVALADAVRSIAPPSAVLGRNGGDEFVAMLFGDDVADADAIFERITNAELGCEHDGKWYHLSFSIGYVGYPEQATALNDAYTKADAALYAVKLAGKAGCKRYSAEVEKQYRSQLGFTPRDIAENVPGAILVHRAGGDGAILFANDELVELFECDNLADFMDYAGGTFAGLVHPDDGPRVYDELVGQVALDEIGAKNFSDYRIITKKGNVKHVANNGRLVEIDEVGKVFYVLIIDSDERLRR